MLRFSPVSAASSTTVSGCRLSAIAFRSAAARSTAWIVRRLEFAAVAIALRLVPEHDAGVESDRAARPDE